MVKYVFILLLNIGFASIISSQSFEHNFEDEALFNEVWELPDSVKLASPRVNCSRFTAQMVRSESSANGEQSIDELIGGDYWLGVTHPIGNRGEFLLSTLGIYDSTSASDAESREYTLTSQEFTINDSLLYFLIGGNAGSIELWLFDDTLGNFQQVLSEKPQLKNKEVLTRKFFYLAPYMGKKAKITISDTSKTGHINADDFFSSNTLLDTETFLFKTTYCSGACCNEPDSLQYDKLTYLKLRDKDSTHVPMWGFCDTHAHWMNHATFGTEFMHGRPYGDLSSALEDCRSIHAKGIYKILYKMYESENNHWNDSYDGYPKFDAWPNFASKFHQSMYIDWVRRAYFGGLRIMVCVTSHAELVAKTLGKKKDMTDDEAVKLAIDTLKRMIDTLHCHGENWLDIAYSSEEAKRLILQNKLAVIIGMEIDQPGGWIDSSNCDEEPVKSYLDSLVNRGVRYIFPIHIANNAFGGYAVYGSEHFAINNFYSRRKSDLDRYVIVEGNPEVSFRLGEEYIRMPDVLAPSFTECYSPPGLSPCGESDYTYISRGMGHINKLGLTSIGKFAITEMMRRKMIIDIDHMSFKSNDSTIVIAKNYKYPLIAGHTNFLEQAFDTSLAGFETAESINKLRNEHAKRKNTVLDLGKLGGMVSPVTEGGKDVLDYKSSKYLITIVNNNPGSSRTWAQTYLYALDKMDNEYVTFGTDMNGYLTEISPRFGTFSAFALLNDKMTLKRLGNNIRKEYAFQQFNGVRYKDVLQDCNDEHKFRGLEVFSLDEAAYLQSLFFKEKGVSGQVPDSIFQFVKGITDALQRSPYLDNALDTIKSLQYKTAYIISRLSSLHPGEIIDSNLLNKDGLYLKFKSSGSRKFRRMLERYPEIYAHWQKMKGTNKPLTRCKMNVNGIIKDFDFNIDGMAQYGMFPDFLQDLKNIGLTYPALTPLMTSAGNFVKMWGKCEISGGKITINKYSKQ